MVGVCIVFSCTNPPRTFGVVGTRRCVGLRKGVKIDQTGSRRLHEVAQERKAGLIYAPRANVAVVSLFGSRYILNLERFTEFARGFMMTSLA